MFEGKLAKPKLYFYGRTLPKALYKGGIAGIGIEMKESPSIDFAPGLRCYMKKQAHPDESSLKKARLQVQIVHIDLCVARAVKGEVRRDSNSHGGGVHALILRTSLGSDIDKSGVRD